MRYLIYKWQVAIWVVASLTCLAMDVRAASIAFVATDLPDQVAAQDLWRYDYTVSGFTFVSSRYFDIYFEPQLYSSLSNATAPGDWDPLILAQPKPGNLPPFDRGIFDAMAKVNDPTNAGTFSVTFVSLGLGSPGPQRFAIFDANSAVLETGITVPLIITIPEPYTNVLFLTGAALLGIRSHRAFRPRS